MEALISAGIGLGTTILGIVGTAVAGAYKTSDELRADLKAAVDEFSGFIAIGGEMDKRRDAARAKTDSAIDKAEEITKP